MAYQSRAHIPWSLKAPLYEAIGYKPFGAQEPFHRSTALHRIFGAGNQSGKTYCGAREIFPQLVIPIYDPTLGAARGRRGWVVVPRYSLADPIVSEIINVLEMFGFKRVARGGTLREGEFHWAKKTHHLTVWTGAELWVKSADEPAALHAQPLDWILIDEGGLVPFEIYQVSLVPRLTVTGGWIAALGTFEDTIVGKWFEDYWYIGQMPNDRGIESFRHPTTANPYVDKAWLEEQRKNYDPDLFAARFEAIPKPNTRLVFRTFSFADHVDAELATFDPQLPVYLGVDPGGVYGVVVLQIKYVEGRGDVVCVIDEYYDQSGKATPTIVDELRKRKWWRNLGLNGEMMGAIDKANKESRQLWRNAGVKLAINAVPIEAGNDLLRSFLSQRRFVVHPKCRNFLLEMKKYSYPRRTAGREVRAGRPVDEYNHLIKATIYFLVAKFGWCGIRPDKRQAIPPRRWWSLK